MYVWANCTRRVHHRVIAASRYIYEVIAEFCRFERQIRRFASIVRGRKGLSLKPLKDEKVERPKVEVPASGTNNFFLPLAIFLDNRMLRAAAGIISDAEIAYHQISMHMRVQPVEYHSIRGLHRCELLTG